MGKLEGKVAVITGAASGIGEASALRFAAEGAAVMCADVNIDGAQHTASQITERGGSASATPGYSPNGAWTRAPAFPCAT